MLNSSNPDYLVIKGTAGQHAAAAREAIARNDTGELIQFYAQMSGMLAAWKLGLECCQAGIESDASKLTEDEWRDAISDVESALTEVRDRVLKQDDD